MNQIEKKLNYFFKNPKLLEQSLTHPSCKNTANYERLEFLGDSVLNLIISEYLINKHDSLNEGDLAPKRSYLINGELISSIAENLEIGKYLVMAKSEINSGGEKNKNNLENALEAIIGAIFLDSDYEKTKEFVLNLWQEFLNREMSHSEMNPKSFVQEWASSKDLPHPKYIQIGQEGPDHNKIFTIRVEINNFGAAEGKGYSIKKAEIDAAKNLIKFINKE